MPTIDSIWLSFCDVSLKSRKFVGISNYLDLIHDPVFWFEVRSTLTIVSMLVPLLIVLSLFISVVVVKMSRFRSFFRAAFYLPSVSAGVVTSLVWLWIFNPAYGLLNYLLSLFGLGPLIWLGEPTLAKLSVVVVVLSWVIGANVILYMSALLGVPKSIYEAAEIDGANSTQKFFKITLPLITPTTLYVLVMSTIGAFQIWEAIYFLTGGGPAYATTTFVYRVYQLGFLYFEFGKASTHAVVLFAIIFMISYFQFKFLKKELEY